MKATDRSPPRIALIDEARCIGCALCLTACPTDAIVGASGMMHTVVTRDCIGCERCLPPCPVDCISMLRNDAVPNAADKQRLAEVVRRRRRRLARRSREAPRIERKIVLRALARARRRLAAAKD
jgi:electron transport complex protein RnfB